jgi:import inner membrane translocase subunit TIM50
MLRRHVRTLVLDLDDTLIHSDWTRGRGWKTFKRPGAEDFIRNMAQFYELVCGRCWLPQCTPRAVHGLLSFVTNEGRPCVFLSVAQVVYTDQLPTYADPILDRLDPQRFIQYRLYRDSTQYVNGKHVRPRTLWAKQLRAAAHAASRCSIGSSAAQCVGKRRCATCST